jgi:hypothetical protein
LDRFHHLADIRQASPAFGILRCAVAAPRFFFQGDFFANQRAAVFYIIIFDIPFRKIETMADKVIGVELIFFSTIRRDFNHGSSHGFEKIRKTNAPAEWD